MCIILGNIQSVSKTNLFVLPNKDKTRQMTFYSNAVSTPNENMMILPVPGGHSVTLHTIQYTSLFHDLKKSVKRIEEESSSGNMRSLSASASLQKPELLKVFDHGSYRVSIAPQIEDLSRLDSRLFPMTPELFEFFRSHYTREFGYLCCVLKPGLKQYEPLCYSHPLHSSGRMFVPTLHYHVHDDHIETDHADWDHLIYSVGTEERANRGFTSNYSNSLDWSSFPKEFEKLTVSSIRCAEIKGDYKNQDMSFALW